MSFFVACLSFLLVHSSLAAPFPSASSAAFAHQKPGLYFSPEGFSVHSEKTAWVHKETPLTNKNILAFYKSPAKDSSLTVRVDHLKKRSQLDHYVKSWKKDYLKFGMNIINSKKVKVGTNKGFMIDLLNSKKNKFIRQIVFLKNKKAVVLTCRTPRKNLKANLPSCNQMFKNFAWM